MVLEQWVASLAQARWQFATTMPRWLHVYTVRDWWPAESRFVAACEYIDAVGSVIPWPPPPGTPVYNNRYVVLDGLKFWAMGPLGDRDAPSARTVINCALADTSVEDRHASVEMRNQIGAWSDLSTRLSSLIQSGSTAGSAATSRSTSGVAKT